MTLESVLVYDPTANSTQAAVQFREDLAAAVEEGVGSLLVATAAEASMVRHRVTSETLLVVEATAQIELELELAASPPARVWTLVLPLADRRAPEGARWVEAVRRVADSGVRPRFLVDSEESRDQVEAVLKDRRVEVLVLAREVPRAERREAAWTYAGGALTDHVRTEPRWDESWWGSAEAEVLQSHAPAATTWRRPEADAALAQLLRSEDVEQVDADVAILGANLNFIGQLADRLGRGHVRNVRSQEWTRLSGPPDAEAAQQLIDTSDAIIAEWIRPNAEWIQRHAPLDKRLIVRGHRYEVTTDFPRRVDMGRYDAAVVITPWVGRELVRTFGWPERKIVYIPNFVESSYFKRPKLDGAQFTLGMVGIRPALKRVDLALDLLRGLRAIDPRYNLRIRSALPFDYINWEKDAASRAQWHETLFRIKHDPSLRGAVFFDEPGQDMSSWFRQVGVVLSLSDLEGSHVALAEGIASGALGVARRWPGVLGLWPERLVHDSMESAISAILAVREDGALEAATETDRALGSLDAARVVGAWKALLAGDVDAARASFGALDMSVDTYAPHPLD